MTPPEAPQPLPLARTDAPNTFAAPQTLYSFLDFDKPGGAGTDGGIRFKIRNDPIISPDGVHTHYVQWALDYATTGELNGVPALGSYLACYDNKLNLDILKIGVVAQWAGRFAFGADAIIPSIQVSIHDLPGVTQGVDLYCNKNGLLINGRAMASDGCTLQRDDNTVARWHHLHQGSGVYDYRYGMEPVAGSYDFVICNPNGEAPSSAENPGPVRLRLKPDGTLISPTITALEQRLSELEAFVRSITK